MLEIYHKNERMSFSSLRVIRLFKATFATANDNDQSALICMLTRQFINSVYNINLQFKSFLLKSLLGSFPSDPGRTKSYGKE